MPVEVQTEGKCTQTIVTCDKIVSNKEAHKLQHKYDKVVKQNELYQSNKKKFKNDLHKKVKETQELRATIDNLEETIAEQASTIEELKDDIIQLDQPDYELEEENFIQQLEIQRLEIVAEQLNQEILIKEDLAEKNKNLVTLLPEKVNRGVQKSLEDSFSSEDSANFSSNELDSEKEIWGQFFKNVTRPGRFIRNALIGYR